MPKTIIEAFPKEKRQAQGTGEILYIAECFADTIQGENFVGVPSTFIRFRTCTLNCTWCDTLAVWRKGNPYYTSELLDMFDKNGVSQKLLEGQHLIFTGGSPVRQQTGILSFLSMFVARYGKRPFTEIENECTLMPSDDLIQVIDRWNNSPKLESSLNPKELRYKPEILKLISSLSDSWFKFVITSDTADEDWAEIERDFLNPGLIRKDQIVLMPEGATREELRRSYPVVVEMAVKHSLRMTDRLHVTIWDLATGV